MASTDTKQKKKWSELSRKQKVKKVVVFTVVGFVALSVLAGIFGEDTQKAADSVRKEVKESVQNTEPSSVETNDSQAAESEPNSEDSQQNLDNSTEALIETAIATCKKHTESQVYVAPASAKFIGIDDTTSEISVMAVVKDTAGEYIAQCLLSPNGRQVKDFKVAE